MTFIRSLAAPSPLSPTWTRRICIAAALLWMCTMLPVERHFAQAAQSLEATVVATEASSRERWLTLGMERDGLPLHVQTSVSLFRSIDAGESVRLKVDWQTRRLRFDDFAGRHASTMLGLGWIALMAWLATLTGRPTPTVLSLLFFLAAMLGYFAYADSRADTFRIDVIS